MREQRHERMIRDPLAILSPKDQLSTLQARPEQTTPGGAQMSIKDQKDDQEIGPAGEKLQKVCLLYTSPSPRDGLLSRMPSSA